MSGDAGIPKPTPPEDVRDRWLLRLRAHGAGIAATVVVLAVAFVPAWLGWWHPSRTVAWVVLVVAVLFGSGIAGTMLSKRGMEW